MKVLNLYAGIGGNRKLWDDVEVTAVEWEPEIAAIYQDFFPDDTMIITDAHSYLLEHFKEYDFIWSSPPCPTHSVTNNFLHSQGAVRYPDMSLWQEIVFLRKWHKGYNVVENVISYYEPLYKPTELDRHYFWANFLITPFRVNRDFNISNARASSRQEPLEYERNLEEYHGFKLPDGVINKRLLLRNCVYPPLGKHVLDCARGNTQLSLSDFRTKLSLCAEEKE